MTSNLPKNNQTHQVVFALLLHNCQVRCVTGEKKAFWQLYGNKPVITEAPKPRHSDVILDR